ncbi:hypothetical protein LV79_005344 [Actinokineospora globicatena]|uniref:Uncharacterized protein n=1 Tax=Actinokineospora globicatena TaxID=103729 RepID=A0A9W6QTU8_9PSEU|nr:hypothetical protein [Actinokineospora globicatena]GLW81502.1 hypothetical protein Aglo01_59830 [Actinokineospora globicatena]GLW87800.1 hypothetical protein Aglo02_54390 [Actinokineospora globicatena]GLW94477.1 hypothetical protein Aglo03_52930 [Actinokineospora globicatena]
MVTSTNTAPHTGRRWLFLAVWLLWFAVGFPYPAPTWQHMGVAALVATGAATLMVLAATAIGWWQHRPRRTRS